MFYLVSSEPQKCKSREISSQFKLKCGWTGFKEMSISRPIFKLESPGFWHNVLFGEFWATKMQISWNLVPVLAKTWINGISRNEYISVNSQARESSFWHNVLLGTFSAIEMQILRNLVPCLAKTWINDISRNEHISVNFQVRESWFLA
jgi:hypothetical protein